MSEQAPDISFALNNIAVESFQFRGRGGETPAEVPEPYFKIARRWSFTTAAELIVIVIKVELSDSEGDGGRILAELSVRYDFHITGISWTPDEAGKRAILHLPEELIETLFSLAYSTTRGILYEKARGTVMDALIMPIVRPKDLVPEDSVFRHEKSVEEVRKESSD